jgi:hypothetical protein
MGHCVRLFVPTENPMELSPIIGRIAGQWGGATVSNASGWWKNERGEVIRDQLSVLECCIGLWDQAARDWWHDLADVVRQEWSQDCVLMTIHDLDGWLVSGPDPCDRIRIGD